MEFLYSLLVTVIVMGLLYWIVSVLPIPQPFKQIAQVIILVICAIYVLGLLFGLAPSYPMFHRHY